MIKGRETVLRGGNSENEPGLIGISPCRDGSAVRFQCEGRVRLL